MFRRFRQRDSMAGEDRPVPAEASGLLDPGLSSGARRAGQSGPPSATIERASTKAIVLQPRPLASQLLCELVRTTHAWSAGRADAG